MGTSLINIGDIPLKVIIKDINVGINNLIINGISAEDAKLFELKCQAMKEKQIKLSNRSELIIANIGYILMIPTW